MSKFSGCPPEEPVKPISYVISGSSGNQPFDREAKVGGVFKSCRFSARSTKNV